MGFSWETGSPAERARTVRAHVAPCFGNGQILCDLFHLSERGLACILAGYKWRPEFDADYQDVQQNGDREGHAAGSEVA